MEHRKKIQHVCATSRYALPVTLIYSVLMLLPAIGINIANQVLAFLLITVATFLMVELNNRNALIRIYSRMVSCSFLVLMMMSRFLLGDYRNGIVAVGIIVAYLILFKAYQDKQSMGLMFYASVIIGFTSFAWIQVLVFMPVIWIFSIFNLQCMSVRSWIASIRRHSSLLACDCGQLSERNNNGSNSKMPGTTAYGSWYGHYRSGHTQTCFADMDCHTRTDRDNTFSKAQLQRFHSCKNAVRDIHIHRNVHTGNDIILT